MKRTAQDQSLDQSTCVYGAGILLNYTQALAGEIEGVRAGSEDIEFIHRARVASRRLRAAFPLFAACLPAKKSKSWQKEIRAVTQALGEARDLDVQVDRLAEFLKDHASNRNKPGLQRLLLRLRQKRQVLQPQVVKAMQKLAKSGTLPAMQNALQSLAFPAEEVLPTQALYQHSCQAILLRLETFLGYEAFVNHPECDKELHEMRIAAKWLRYTMETFAPLYASHLKKPLQAIKLAQELLGDVHDCDVWLEMLPQFLEEEQQRVLEYAGNLRPYRLLVGGIEAFKDDRRQARRQAFEQFACHWAQWTQDEVWSSLKKTIQAPLIQPETLYPPPARSS